MGAVSVHSIPLVCELAQLASVEMVFPVMTHGLF